jgi:hypothetical protein
MTTPNFLPSIERRFQEIERRLQNLRGTVGGTSAIIQFTPGGAPILPGGTIVTGDLSSLGIPPPPTGLTLTRGAGNGDIWVDANWTLPTANGSGSIVSWGISVLKSGDTTPYFYNPPASDAPPYRITGLLPNTTYSVTVWGVTQLGAASQNLGPQNVTTGIDTSVPPQITGVSAFSGYKTMTVTWTALGGAPPDDWKGTYFAQASTHADFSSGNISQNVGNATVATFGGLITGTDYWIRVRAVSPSKINGPYSNIIGPITPGLAQGQYQASDGFPPTTTTNAPSVTRGIRQFYLKWNAISNADPVIYEMHISTTPGFTATNATKAGEVTDGTFGSIKTLNNNALLQYDTNYYFIIRPRDKDGISTAGSSPVSGPFKVVQVNTGDIAVGSITADSAIINDITADVITTGTLNGNIVNVTNLNATNIVTGTIGADIAYLGTINAGKITAGTLNSSVILTSNLSASQITTGSLSASRIGSGSISAGVITITNGGLIQSANYGTSTGWRIDSAGNTILNNAIIRGNIIGSTITGGLFQTNTGQNPKVIIDSASPAFINLYALGYEPVPARVYADTNGSENRIFIRSATDNNIYHFAQMYLISDVGVSSAIFEGDKVYIRAPGPAHPSYTEILGQGASQILNVDGEGSTTNGFQQIKGFMMFGDNATGLGGHPSYGIGLRAFADGSQFRIDTYWALHALGGLFVDGGPKNFVINHPVLGDEWQLSHTTIESPRADLIYRGRIQLSSGSAEVDIDDFYGMAPGTFHALCRTDSRQFFLFNEDGNFPVRGSLNEGILSIECDDSNSWVGWLVVGERNDPQLKENAATDSSGRIIVQRQRTSFEINTIKKVNS